MAGDRCRGCLALTSPDEVCTCPEAQATDAGSWDPGFPYTHTRPRAWFLDDVRDPSGLWRPGLGQDMINL